MNKRIEDRKIKWIGDIPKGWNINKWGKIITVLTDYAANGSFEDLANNVKYLSNEGFARLIRLTDLRSDFNNTGVYVDKNAYDYLKKSSLYGKEILIATIGANAGLVCELPDIDFKATLGPNMMLIKFDENICIQHYMFWLSQSKLIQEQLLIKSKNACAQSNLNKDDIKNVICILPCLEKQQTIANYLDNKCSKIDLLNANLEKEITKLKEYRQSVIKEVITKGLNSNVEMKDSGIKWIGKIPSHWGISKVSNEFQNLDEQRKPISAVNRGNIEDKYNYYGASGIIDKIDNYIFDDTLILIGEDGANLLTRNVPIVYIATGKFWVNNHAHVLKPLNKNDLSYMSFLLESTDLFKYITGSTQAKLTKSNLSTIPVITPPCSEQKQIANYLDNKCSKIIRMIEQKQTLINKLVQYKEALIYECVTGKKEAK